MNLVVTGANGQLGAEMLATAGAAGHTVTGLTRADCDVTDAGQVRTILDETKPDAVVNCAAWTRVDAAETAAAEAFAANAWGPRVLAAACHRSGALLVHVSTDYVFDGSSITPLTEWDRTGPRTLYGASKLAGEQEVRALAPRHQIVRTSWLYGGDGPNFILTMLALAARGGPLRVVADQVGSPTWSGHLAPALLRLIGRDVPGTYHLSNSGMVSWHGLAKEVFAAAGRTVAVEPIATADYPTPAPRPAYSVLDNCAWRNLGEAPLATWQDGVQAYVEALRGRGALPE